MTAVQIDSSEPAGIRQVLLSQLRAMSDRELLHRFTMEGDASAFEVLVRRHGPMVLGVCRRMLRDTHAADDAFQATFLVLVRRAASIRNPELLGNWLYGVAYRTATRARRQAATRQDHEMRIPIMSQDDVVQEVERREFQEALDEELSRLPRNYREPFILCYLQEKTQAEAALLLGCPVGSISGRLTIARERVRTRLSRRGLAFSAAVFPALLLKHSAKCELPTVLVHDSVRSAVWGLQHGGAGGGISSNAHQLAQSVLREMKLQATKRIALAVVGILVICLLASRAITSAMIPPTGLDATFASHDHSTSTEDPTIRVDNSLHASYLDSGADLPAGTVSEVPSVVPSRSSTRSSCRQ